MIKKINYFLIGLLLGVITAYTFSRVYAAVLNRIPPGKEGKCLDINYPEQKVRLRGVVVINDLYNATSMVFYNIGGQIFPQEYTFKNLREAGAKEVDCESN